MRMRGLIMVAAVIAIRCTPLQIAGGGEWSHGDVRPRGEARLGYVEVISSDVRTHEAVWLGATGTLALTTRGAEALIGPELELSRGRGVRTPHPSVDVLYVRPEVGWAIWRRDSGLSFTGASFGMIHDLGSIPITAALRVGDDLRDSRSGFLVGVTLGIVVGSSLYWMQ